MNIAVIGTGYVGLVSATCFADCGNLVYGVDINAHRIDDLRRGIIPIYEPGLDALVQKNHAQGRLHFTTDYQEAITHADIIFLAVGTPQDDAGRADLSYLRKAAETITQTVNGPKTVVIKSTVPVRTNQQLHEYFQTHTSHEIDVASNPEFLKEGTAIDDFTKPGSCRRRSAPTRSRRHTARIVRPVSAHRKTVFGHDAGKCGDDQICRQCHARHQNQFYQ